MSKSVNFKNLDKLLIKQDSSLSIKQIDYAGDIQSKKSKLFI